MFSAIRQSSLALALVGAITPALADTVDEREAWRAQVTEAKARAAQARQKSFEEFERLQTELRITSPPLDVQLSQRNSEAALNDFSLRYGDIVSTVVGMFVFIGRSDAERRPDDFVPYSAPARR